MGIFSVFFFDAGNYAFGSSAEKLCSKSVCRGFRVWHISVSSLDVGNYAFGTSAEKLCSKLVYPRACTLDITKKEKLLLLLFLIFSDHF